MKKIVVIALLVVACGKEQKEVEVSKPEPKALSPVVVPAPQSTGDYAKAVDWVRTSPGFKFDVTVGNVSASGDLTRPQLGQETLRFKAKGEEWTAARHFKGVTWSRNGKPDANEPPYADRIYQWLTLFPDPEKSPVQLVANEGAASHFRFTNLNTNETHDVWVSRADNHLVRLKTSGNGAAFPAVEIAIK